MRVALLTEGVRPCPEGDRPCGGDRPERAEAPGAGRLAWCDRLARSPRRTPRRGVRPGAPPGRRRAHRSGRPPGRGARAGVVRSAPAAPARRRIPAGRPPPLPGRLPGGGPRRRPPPAGRPHWPPTGWDESGAAVKDRFAQRAGRPRRAGRRPQPRTVLRGRRPDPGTGLPGARCRPAGRRRPPRRPARRRRPAGTRAERRPGNPPRSAGKRRQQPEKTYRQNPRGPPGP